MQDWNGMRATLIGFAALAAIAMSACGGEEDDIAAFCDKIDEVRAAEDPFAGISGNDVEGAKAALEEAQVLFGEVADVAPEEIRTDAEEARAFFDDFVDQAQEAENPQDLLALATEFQSEAQEFQETSARLEEFTNENCGPEPGAE